MHRMTKRQHGFQAVPDNLNNGPWFRASGALFLLTIFAGCGSGTGTAPTPLPATTPQVPQVYLAPVVEGTTNGGAAFDTVLTYTLDDVGGAFSQENFAISTQQQGKQVINAGVIAPASRGLLELEVTANYAFNSAIPAWVATDYTKVPPPLPTGFAVELASQAGALVQLPGQPVTPLAPTAQCPNFGTAQTFQFLTIPGAVLKPGSINPQPYTWNPATETAYGSVDVSTSGSTVNLANINQFTLAGVRSNPGVSSVSGTCGPTAYGNTISLPGQINVVNPGTSGGTSFILQAVAGIGPSGLLVEDNGYQGNGPGALQYNNVLGAGTGSIGLPRPGAALDTGALSGAQYLGFIYGAGINPGNSSSPTGWSSHLASFGFSGAPPVCSPGIPATGTLIYGGNFTNDMPSTSPNGFGLCNFAIDLGVQDPNNHGFYPAVTVWIGADYPANTARATYHFPAVAIAGQLQGKFAIFVLGSDTTQPWEIDLLQSK